MIPAAWPVCKNDSDEDWAFQENLAFWPGKYIFHRPVGLVAQLVEQCPFNSNGENFTVSNIDSLSLIIVIFANAHNGFVISKFFTIGYFN